MSIIWVLLGIFVFKKIIDGVYEVVKKINPDFGQDHDDVSTFDLPPINENEKEPIQEVLPKSKPQKPVYTPIDVVGVEGGRLELETLDHSAQEEVQSQSHLLYIEDSNSIELQKTLRKAIIMKEVLEPKWQQE